MKATGWKGGTFGIRVSKKDAAEYFSPYWELVQIEIDGQIRSFPLHASFWKSCPEFRGGRIQEWLLKSGLAPWPEGKPPKLELIPRGGPLFRLEVAPPATEKKLLPRLRWTGRGVKKPIVL
jgi:hypothetical protein